MEKDFKEITLEMVGAEENGGTCSTLADLMLTGCFQGKDPEDKKNHIKTSSEKRS
ncbi:hypothetical protein G4V39_05285 [Thermosulfuriphilus ammonigenes]|uniref:Uncharacterized protein n=1 Tax=Thermosulfuriphilus ammonigenes TaxID=1936021 RepID=A0A6G7PW94_9BACT|nr:hypothetical protein [Thermosulfuriphilus ammonigenes]MBA2848102.1 hypothetical protein [Thermosulfuriphilus ammonigenes]QIJ71718.1 hypothetical protein G4V39_05285 [Thermosulfuriphilus ammonigenes]